MMRPSKLDHSRLSARILIHQDIAADASRLIGASPGIETGGKYVGRVQGTFRSNQKHWKERLAEVSIEVLYSIDPGPNAKRTAVELLPDGPYQSSVFRSLEALHPEVEHLGSWHSHHPNGLGELSTGDIAGYFENANSRNYNLDFFFASLAVSRSGFADARHFMFIRGERNYFELTPESIVTLTGPNPYKRLIDEARDSHEKTSRLPERVSIQGSKWYETPEGKQLLVEDRNYFKALGEFQSIKRGGELAWRGTISTSGVKVLMTYVYPSGFPGIPATLEITVPTHPDFLLRCILSPTKHRIRVMRALADCIESINSDTTFAL